MSKEGDCLNSILKSKKFYWISLIIIFIVFGGRLYYTFLYTPKNSIELYQAISFADDFEEAQTLIEEGYEDRFSEEDFEYIKRLDTTALSISQLTLFEYDETTYVIMTTPGTTKLKVLAVEELPIDIRNYFFELSE